MSGDRRLEVAAQFTDDVLAKLARAFFQVIKQEGWGKRDLAAISGINETAIGHILAGRRKNLTVETIALLTRAMRARPELILHDLRPMGNNVARLSSAAAALQEDQVHQPSSSISRTVARAGSVGPPNSLRELEAAT
jgi:transcriptional regulator with XRE-family HTH domain